MADPLRRVPALPWRFTGDGAERLARAFGAARVAQPDAPLAPELQVVLAHLLREAGELAGAEAIVVEVPEDPGRLIDQALEGHLYQALETAFPGGRDAEAVRPRTRALQALRALADAEARRGEGLSAVSLERAVGSGGSEILEKLATPLTRLVVPRQRPDGWHYVLSHARMAEPIVRMVEMAPEQGADGPSGDAMHTLLRAGKERKIGSLAVLPLANHTGDPEQQWFVDGMTDQLIATLSQVPEVKITSRTSVMAYKDAKKPVSEIAGELGVDAVIEGSVMREGDRVRITVQLVDASSDRNLWSQQYDRRLRDVLALHSEVAEAVVPEIAVTLDPQVIARLTRAVQVDEEAYLAYLRGREHFAKWTKADWKQAIRYYEEAIALAPDFGRGHAALAEVYTLLGAGLGVMPWRDATAKGRMAAIKAIELDPTLAEAHVALAQVYMREWSWKASEEEFRRAIELNPSYVPAHQFYATLLQQLQRLDEAMAEARKAAELQPEDPSLQCLIAGPLHYAKRYQEAIVQLERVIEEHPDFGLAHVSVSQGYALTGRYEEAIVEAEKALELMGGDYTSPKVVMACAYAWSGRPRQALALLRELEARHAEREDVPSALIGTVYHGLGEEEKALDWLERSYEQRETALPLVVSDPWLDGLWDHPRFQALRKKMGLPVDSPAGDSLS